MILIHEVNNECDSCGSDNFTKCISVGSDEDETIGFYLCEDCRISLRNMLNDDLEGGL